ncbi:unnamed protein product [Bursaphelenchus okinawaensis]|uniref:Uncharacterized protein n=1 Tax=Bursaphelenchus okinawaensis TaxID=465554 RepID=A0A811KWC4_9BILA|nr:unnamed protein product [Bursaphelenchus okinawaensis]CAG9112834.1 unnamed protein product [Bursaphelenchus okinawaensis]
MIPTTKRFTYCTLATVALLVVTVAYIVTLHVCQVDTSIYLSYFDLYTVVSVFTTAFVLGSVIEFHALHRIGAYPYITQRQHTIMCSFYKILFTVSFLMSVFMPFGLLLPPQDACKILFFLVVNTVVSYLWVRTYVKLGEKITDYCVEMMVLNQSHGTEILLSDALSTYELEYNALIAKSYQQDYADIQGDKKSILKYHYLKLHSIIAAVSKELEDTTVENREYLQSMYSNLVRETENYRIPIEEDNFVRRYVNKNWQIPSIRDHTPVKCIV